MNLCIWIHINYEFIYFFIYEFIYEFGCTQVTGKVPDAADVSIVELVELSHCPEIQKWLSSVFKLESRPVWSLGCWKLTTLNRDQH